ncbi:hypothetical protein LTR05_000318 [Lithohypha guttulata]|uniref:DNA replication regulator Sld3 C-terminal domain-containing protein n=1 Tax=Lithohypha guttulata TaxID=1690604 RepID=A0AAN7T4B2_9EURO|nr:hypothetical protein LTR05_000318 [Lithohypha guttulata]
MFMAVNTLVHILYSISYGNMLPSPPAEMACQSSVKRKRSDIEAEEKRDCSFQLENLNTSSFHTFESLSKLLRAHLPLSWLSTNPANSSIPSGSILQGAIKHVTSWEYSVLAVRNIPNGGLFILEKVDSDVFVTHPLQPFVTEKWLQDASVGAVPPVSLQMVLHYVPEPELPMQNTSRRTPSLSSLSDLKVPKNRRGAAARLSILSHTSKQEETTPSPTLEQLPAHIVQPEVPEQQRDEFQCAAGRYGYAEDIPEPIPSVQHTAEDQSLPDIVQRDMLTPDYLRQRYLDNLYKSKESLAYYTKGPLSRARVRARAPDASMTLSELAAFYRETLLPVKKEELKYKQSIKQLIVQSVSTQRPDSGEQLPEKRSARKRTKLGKDGLWPAEHEYILRWWQARNLAPLSKEHQEAELDRGIASLRMRDAQMQIIHILEILSIEAKQPKLSLPEEETTTTAGAEHLDTKMVSIESDPPTQKSTKPVKKRNLETDLGLLADKLCIWHVLGMESLLPSVDDPEQSKIDDATSRDRLRSFCTDVLIPFYNSKLPLLCKSLCKTLAGPEVYEQVQKAARIKDNLAQPFPSATTVRSRPSSRAGTLQRVLSEEGIQLPSPPPLARSSTLPPVPHFKSETSDLSRRTPDRQASLSFSNRLVDLEADSQATAHKKRKLERVASQKQELAAAIQALKKPNRTRAGKAYMDELEQRSLELKTPILITATPRAERRKTIDDIPALPPPPLQDLAIPSSTIKPRAGGASSHVLLPSSSRKKAVLAAINSTPTRGTSRLSDPLQISNKSSTVQHSDLVSKQAMETIFSTPKKQVKTPSASKENGFHLPDLAFKTMDRAMKMPVGDSIYDELGWNDDDEM